MCQVTGAVYSIICICILFLSQMFWHLVWLQVLYPVQPCLRSWSYGPVICICRCRCLLSSVAVAVSLQQYLLPLPLHPGPRCAVPVTKSFPFRYICCCHLFTSAYICSRLLSSVYVCSRLDVSVSVSVRIALYLYLSSCYLVLVLSSVSGPWSSYLVPVASCPVIWFCIQVLSSGSVTSGLVLFPLPLQNVYTCCRFRFPFPFPLQNVPRPCYTYLRYIYLQT